MISQEAFDETVLENMEEFELSKEEALIETIKQYKSMGRDLSSIDTTGGEVRRNILNLITQLRNDISTIKETIQSLQEVLLSNNNHLNIFRGSGGVIAVLDLINFNHDKMSIQVVLEFLISISKNNVEVRDLFEPGGAEKLCNVIQQCLVLENIQQDEILSLLKTSFRCVKVMSKSENNKVGFVNQNIHQLIFQFVIYESTISSTTSTPLVSSEVLKEICLTIKSLCTHDDQRKEMSCAYDNSKKFLSDGIIPHLIRYSQHYLLNPDLAACSLSALRQLILSEEAVKIACSNGIMTLPKQILISTNSTIPLIRSVVGLIRNLCADDGLKNSLVSDGIIALLVYYMNREEYQSDGNIMEHILAILAAIALRYPNNSTMIVNEGAIDEIVSIMRRYSNRPTILRQACLTIRNIASRSPELRKKLLDYGLETLLREAGRYQDCVDEAYAALRDLECQVQYVKISNTHDSSTSSSSGGTAIVETAYEQFGVNKPKFNPVFEETYDIMNRVEEKATAPFAASNNSSSGSKSVFRIDEDDDDDNNDYNNNNNNNNNGNVPHVHSENCCH